MPSLCHCDLTNSNWRESSSHPEEHDPPIHAVVFHRALGQHGTVDEATPHDAVDVHVRDRIFESIPRVGAPDVGPGWALEALGVLLVVAKIVVACGSAPSSGSSRSGASTSGAPLGQRPKNFACNSSSLQGSRRCRAGTCGTPPHGSAAYGRPGRCRYGPVPQAEVSEAGCPSHRGSRKMNSPALMAGPCPGKPGASLPSIKGVLTPSW